MSKQQETFVFSWAVANARQYMVKAIPLVKNYGPVKKRGSWTLRQKFIGFSRRDPSNITIKCQRQESLRDSVTRFFDHFL